MAAAGRRGGHVLLRVIAVGGHVILRVIAIGGLVFLRVLAEAPRGVLRRPSFPAVPGRVRARVR